jgi:hypothetical protein
MPVGCCGCAEGGKQKAVPVAHKERLERERKKKCAETMCPFVMSTDPSCAARAGCEKGTCVLVP